MTTLADLKVGNQFLFVCQVESITDNGIGLDLYGPSNQLAAQALINPQGAMSGSLMNTPGEIPVTIVTGFVPFSVGDILQKDSSGETMLCRWSNITPEGVITWSASVTHEVVYSSDGWSVIGHFDLS